MKFTCKEAIKFGSVLQRYVKNDVCFSACEIRGMSILSFPIKQLCIGYFRSEELKVCTRQVKS